MHSPRGPATVRAISSNYGLGLRTVAHHAAMDAASWVLLATVLALVLAALCAYLFASRWPPWASSDDDNDPGPGWGGGGGGPGRGPAPGSGPTWWPEFERQFATHVEGLRQGEWLRTRA